MSLSGVDWLVESSVWTFVWALCSLSFQVEPSVYKPHIQGIEGDCLECMQADLLSVTR